MEFLDPERWHEINEILQEVQGHTPSRRSTVLEEACGDDEALRREVETLLDADAAYEDVVDDGAAVLAQSPSLEVGQRVGAYRLHQRIGEGGTSLVYRAERVDEQFERNVPSRCFAGWWGGTKRPSNASGPNGRSWLLSRIPIWQRCTTEACFRTDGPTW